MDLKIHLTQEPYIQNGLYRVPTEEGTPGEDFLQGPWWQANAEESSGSPIEYTVIWTGSENKADIDWKNPTFVIARGDVSFNITGQAELTDNEFLCF